MYNFHKKEAPLLGLLGSGGGLASRLTGSAAASLYVDDVFSTFLYDGNSSTQTITNGIDLSGEGGAVLLKKRSASSGTVWTDTVRGANKHLRSDNTNSEYTESNILTAFDSDGFDMGDEGDVNQTSQTYCSWSFRKAPGFFDIVTYTGNETVRTISHSLGSVPGMVIIKEVSGSGSWEVYHRSTGNEKTLRLNSTNGQGGTTAWNDTTPTSTNFTVSASTDVNQTGETYVAYIFAHDDQVFGTDSDEAIIKCGSYAGNGSSGQIIDFGFEPQWVMIKSYTRGGVGYGWTIIDMMRIRPLFAEETGSEGGIHGYIPSPNGLHLTNGDSNVNESGESYIYMAIRRPHKPPSAATDVFAIDTYGGTSPTPPTWNSGFPVDWAFYKYSDQINEWAVGTRLMPRGKLVLNTNAVESSDSSHVFDYMNGWLDNTGTLSTLYSWMFKRAPGFFDVVTWTGASTDGSSSRALTHNLDAIPELIIGKRRSFAGNWSVYSSATGINNELELNNNNPVAAATNMWKAAPTSSNFTVGYGLDGSTHTFVGYLFATLSGISKVGSYTGTGSDINVDCGFSNGARFVLVKRTDDYGNWMLFDSTRGIVSGADDPYFQSNTSSAQKTDENHISPLNAGFTVIAASGDLNTSGASYIFLAIA